MPLIEALNELPGIDTIASCSGHGEKPFWINFTADTVRDVAPVSWALLGLGGRWRRWRIEVVFGGFGCPVPWYTLEGPTDDVEGREKLVRGIRQVIEHGIASCIEGYVRKYIADSSADVDPVTARQMALQGSAIMSYDGEPVRPDYDDSAVGHCSEKCPSYDGKRCRVTGEPPTRKTICYPWAASTANRERP